MVKTKGIEDDDRNGEHDDERQLRIHPQHEDQREQQKQEDPDQVGHLLGEKSLQGFDVGGAALNDVAGAVLHVPGIGEALDMRKETVAHGLDQRLGGAGPGELIAVER